MLALEKHSCADLIFLPFLTGVTASARILSLLKREQRIEKTYPVASLQRELLSLPTKVLMNAVLLLECFCDVLMFLTENSLK